MPLAGVYPSPVTSPDYRSDATLRRVRTNGQIKWKGELVYLSESLVGEPVYEMRRHLFEVVERHREAALTPGLAAQICGIGHHLALGSLLRDGRRCPNRWSNCCVRWPRGLARRST